MKVLPGAPLMAVAIRGATGAHTLGLPLSGVQSAPEGPTANAGTSTAGSLGSLGGAASAATGVGTEAGTGIEGALAQSQDMNLYYLQVQEQVNAQNRSFTTLSNVLKTEHETVKTAIGNIR